MRGVALIHNDPGYIDDVRNGRSDIGAVKQRQGRPQGSWLVNDEFKLTQDDTPFGLIIHRLRSGLG